MSDQGLPLDEAAAASLSRRQAVVGGTVALAAFLGFSATTTSASAATAGRSDQPRGKGSSLGFAAVPVSTADTVAVPPGYVAGILAPWGQPLSGHRPSRRPADDTAAEQALRIGTHHSGLHFFPYDDGPRGNRRGTLVIGHEYTDAALLYPDGGAEMTKEKVAKALAAQGLSVVEVRENGDTWTVVDSPRNVRVTGSTPVTFSGPVRADHPALHTGSAPRGTLGNSSYGVTPWGTYLSCEENVAAYFGTGDSGWRATRAQKRYGLSALGHGYRWHQADPRFDLAVNGNEANRYGWVVEIDPHAPLATPVKRTALGRFQHVAATVTEDAEGRVVVYSGDDENGGYVYKFVGQDSWRRSRAQGRSPLDHGTLYVARFEDDGTGRWLPLTHGTGPLTRDNGWQDQADVVLRARLAADALGATPLDRPQQTAVRPDDGTVFCALANSPGRGHCASGPNAHRPAVSPRAVNPYGHIIRWREEENTGEDEAPAFRWDVVVLAGDPARDEAVSLDADGMFGSPKGLWFDAEGLLWIGTGISAYHQHRAATGHENLGNNALLAADPRTGEIRRFLTGPRGAEITGVVTTPDGRTMFVNIQHPGERTPGWGAPTQDDPRAVSDWPDRDPAGPPRSAVLVVRRVDGGVIGAV